jgi:predicted NBD/HSP70 family sugar kinase
MLGRAAGHHQQASSPGHSRLFNLRLVLEVVRLQGPMSRAELARRTKLTKQTVGVIADQLCSAGLLREEGRKKSGIGKPSTQLSLNPAGAFTIGLHLDRDRLVGIVCDLAGQPSQRLEREVSTETLSSTVLLLSDLVAALLANAGLDRRLILGVGLVMPGPFGVERFGPTSLPGWDGPTLARELSDEVGISVLLENDATASAIAEHHVGIARGMRNFCLIYLGIGLGVGVIVDGQPYGGAGSNAGEFGHLIVREGGPACSCGNAGCLERYVSLDSAFLFLASRRRPISSLAQFRREIGPDDPDMRLWMESVAGPLRTGINALENLFDPELIVFGGDAPEWLIDGLIAAAQPLLPSVRAQTGIGRRLQRAATQQDMAALGAATVVLFDTLNPSYKWLFPSPGIPRSDGGPGLELLRIR